MMCVQRGRLGIQEPTALEGFVDNASHIQQLPGRGCWQTAVSPHLVSGLAHHCQM